MSVGTKPAGIEVNRSQLWSLAALLLALAGTLILYGPTLDQPYFWDDVPHYEFATSRSFLQIWSDVRGLSYYRPLTFTLYKLFFDLLPPGATTGPHIFLLLVHAINGWLAALLTRTLLTARTAASGRDSGAIGGLLAASLFILYPFAVLPVCHFAAMMHLLVTTFVLGAVLSLGQYMRTHRASWLGLAVALSLLAPFVHESGIMAGAVALSVALLRGGLPRRREAVRLAIPCLAGALFLPVWLAVPKSPNTFSWTGWGGTLASATFFLQGPSFPFQWLARPIVDHLVPAGSGTPWIVAGLPWWVLATTCGLALLALLLAGWVLRSARRGWILPVSLAWALLAALPSIVVLPFHYVSVSQRLLYCGGPPAALLWAATFVSATDRLRRPILRLSLALGLAAAAAAVPVLYLQREVALHELALQPLEQLAAIVRRLPDERHLVVNPVNWVNYRRPWYMLGHEGVSVSADYVDFGALVRLNSGTNTRLRAVTFAEIRSEADRYYYSTIGEDQPWDWSRLAERVSRFDRTWITVYGDEQIETAEAGSVQQGAPLVPGEYLASFQDGVFLLEADLQLDEQTAMIDLGWKVLSAPPGASIFCHVLDCQGNLLGQGDGPALGRTLLFELLAAGSEVHDLRQVMLDKTPEDGCLALGVGLYLPDGTRLKAGSFSGQSLSGDAYVQTFQLDPTGSR